MNESCCQHYIIYLNDFFEYSFSRPLEFAWLKAFGKFSNFKNFINVWKNTTGFVKFGMISFTQDELQEAIEAWANTK